MSCRQPRVAWPPSRGYYPEHRTANRDSRAARADQQRQPLDTCSAPQAVPGAVPRGAGDRWPPDDGVTGEGLPPKIWGEHFNLAAPGETAWPCRSSWRCRSRSERSGVTGDPSPRGKEEIEARLERGSRRSEAVAVQKMRWPPWALAVAERAHGGRPAGSEPVFEVRASPEMRPGSHVTGPQPPKRASVTCKDASQHTNGCLR